MVTISKQQAPAVFAEGINFDAWLQHVAAHRSEAELQQIRNVHALMDGVVEYQQDLLGDTEYTRALKVAEILADLHIDTNTLVATMLHGVLPSHDIGSEQIEQMFGKDVLQLVMGINKMRIVDAYQVHHADEQHDKKSVERIRKLLLALAEDIRVVVIKIAERVYTMRKLKLLSDEVRRQIAAETKDIFAPLASRLGIWQLKWELEDLSFRYLEPETYKHVASMLDERRIDRENFINAAMAELTQELQQAGIDAHVSGRPKHIYSIWRKMVAKNIGFDELFDVRAVRVLVNSIADCYAALGIVHNKWRPIPSEFDDYIATPKENNYQSLHTAVIGPDNKTLEVQIRTSKMHEHAEYGVASHWGYKEGGKQDVKYQEKITWLRQLLELKDEDVVSEDLVERFKSEIFEDRVYVLTPKGKVIDLPRGATPLDFAYHVHTEVGHHFRGAKADGKIVPIGYELQNGQQVEVLTSKHTQPSRDWLNPHLGYIKSPRARAKIRAWFKQQDQERNIAEGRVVLDRELQRLGIAHIQYEQIGERFGIHKVDEFLAALGRGDITTNQVAVAVNELVFPVAEPGPAHSVHLLQPRRDKQAPGDVYVQGVGDLMTHTALCCHPVPYDSIAGYITRGRGVTIHRRDCPNLQRLQIDEGERVIEVEWGSTSPRRTYPVEIMIQAYDRQGLLQDVSTILTNSHLSVTAMNMHTDKKTLIAHLGITIEVANVNQLSAALTKIEHLRNVIKVSRKNA